MVSPNLVKETIFLDKHGNQIDQLKGGKVIKAKDEEVIPETITDQATGESKPNPLAAIIEAKVQEAVVKSIAKIDIGAMVEKAISDAFGGE